MQKHQKEAFAAIKLVTRAAKCQANHVGVTSNDHVKIEVRRGDHFLGYIAISCSPKNPNSCVGECRRKARNLVRTK